MYNDYTVIYDGLGTILHLQRLTSECLLINLRYADAFLLANITSNLTIFTINLYESAKVFFLSYKTYF